MLHVWLKDGDRPTGAVAGHAGCLDPPEAEGEDMGIDGQSAQAGYRALGCNHR